MKKLGNGEEVKVVVRQSLRNDGQKKRNKCQKVDGHKEILEWADPYYRGAQTLSKQWSKSDEKFDIYL